MENEIAGVRMNDNNRVCRRGNVVAWLVFCFFCSAFINMAQAADTDLLIVKQVSTTTPAAGETFTYTIRYRCASISALYCAAPTITDTISAPLKIVSYSPMGGSVAGVTLAGKTLTWRLATPSDSLPEGVPADSLAAGSTGIVKVQVKFPSCGSAAPPATLSNVAIAETGGIASTSTAPDVTVPAGIDAACPTTPPAPSPGFAKTGSAAFVQPGGLERWSVSLPTSPTAYTVTEIVPAGMQVYSATASNTPKIMSYPEVDCTDDGVDDFHTSACPTTLLPSGLTVSSIKRLRWTVAANIAPQTLDLRLVVDGNYVGDGIRNCAVSSQHGTSCAPLIPVLGQGEPMLSISKITPTGGVVSADGTSIVYAVPVWKSITAPAPASNDHVYRVGIGLDELSGTDTQYPIVEDVLPAGLDYVTGQGGNWWRVSVPSSGVSSTQTACTTPRFSRTLQVDGRVKLRWEFPGCRLPVGQSDTALAVYFSARIRPGTLAGTRITNVATLASGDHPQVTCVNGADAGKTQQAFCRSSNVSFDVPELTNLDSVKWVKGRLDKGYNRAPNVGQTDLSGEGAYVLEIRNTGNVTDTQLDVIDSLPGIGDTALVTGAARQSQWSTALAGDITLQRVANDGSTAAIPASEVVFDPQYADTAFSLRWTPTLGLAPGEKLRISVPVRQLTGEAAATNGQVAWNSFAYTASYFDTTSKAKTTLLTTEPPKVGLAMVDVSAVAGLGDYVWFDTNGDGQQAAEEPPLEGVSVRLYDGATLVAETLTDAAGHYAFWGLLPNHAYSVKLDKAEDYLAGNPLGGMKPVSIDHALTGAAGSFTPDYDMGFTLPAGIGDKVWFDLNGDGAQDDNEAGVEGVTVTLKEASGASVATIQTNAAGAYWFDNVLPGSYYLEFTDLPVGYVPTASGMTGDKQTDSDADASGKTALTQLDAGERDLSWDMGLSTPRHVDLSLSKSVDKTNVLRGDSVVYTLSVHNAGADDASGVQVRDKLPDTLQFLHASPVGEYNPLTGVWNVGWLAANGSASVRITAQAR